MYLCYIDESGTPDIPGNTSHFILLGISIPIWKWKYCEKIINQIKARYGLSNAEIHTGWMVRKYFEQSKIPNFESLSYHDRGSEVRKLRSVEILRLQRAKNPKLYKQTRKNYKQTEDYTHLTFKERREIVLEIAKTIGSWGFARVFAECINKIHFDPTRSLYSVDEQAFDQLVSRFEHHLRHKNDSKPASERKYGILIHDNNETVAKKHTDLMKSFHRKGTNWIRLRNIIETPLFVNSELTSMVQIADLCSYSVRRYLENGEEDLFDEILKRADRKGRKVVGIRHFTEDTCGCKICANH